MKNYHCKCCSFSSHIRTHYDNHLKTKKHQKLAEISPKLA